MSSVRFETSSHFIHLKQSLEQVLLVSTYSWSSAQFCEERERAHFYSLQLCVKEKTVGSTRPTAAHLWYTCEVDVYVEITPLLSLKEDD